ncbi:MAG: prepilin-type N-terminal cleavage/methylation domain-containing protein [bacterium]
MQKLFEKFNKKKHAGFTLIETLVAVSIFSLSILALLVVLTQGIANNNYAKKKIIAGYLAQEGIEYIRNMRDTFVLYPDNADTPTGWVDFKAYLVAASCDIGAGCYYNADTLFSIAPPKPIAKTPFYPCVVSCPNIMYKDDSGEYGYSIGSLSADSGYSRKIEVRIIGENEVEIFSTVSWAQGSGTYSMTFSEDLFNWI